MRGEELWLMGGGVVVDGGQELWVMVGRGGAVVDAGRGRNCGYVGFPQGNQLSIPGA